VYYPTPSAAAAGPHTPGKRRVRTVPSPLRETLTTDAPRDPQARPRGDGVRAEHAGFDAYRPVSLRMRNPRREVLLAGDSSGAVFLVFLIPNIITGDVPLTYVSCSRHFIQLRRAGRLQIALGGRCVLVPAGRYLCFVFARSAARGLVFPYVYVVSSQQGGIHDRFGLV
jgi:hypothetical protein